MNGFMVFSGAASQDSTIDGEETDSTAAMDDPYLAAAEAQVESFPMLTAT